MLSRRGETWCIRTGDMPGEGLAAFAGLRNRGLVPTLIPRFTTYLACW